MSAKILVTITDPHLQDVFYAFADTSGRPLDVTIEDLSRHGIDPTEAAWLLKDLRGASVVEHLVDDGTFSVEVPDEHAGLFNTLRGFNGVGSVADVFAEAVPLLEELGEPPASHMHMAYKGETLTFPVTALSLEN